jgi:YegS/Rv2252/BmrU family lipid kinase
LPSPTSQAVFLVNPASANGSTAKRWPKLYARAKELGLDGDQVLSERPGHLTELARIAADEGKLIVVVGGDGTLNEVVNGVVGTNAEIAVLPNGTGQDFGRTHDIPANFDDAVRVAIDGVTREVDLGRCTFVTPDGTEGIRIFANVGSAGMSGAVAARANAGSKALGGRATFYYALVREFVAWQNTNVTVTYDGGHRRGPMHDVIVANGRWHGGGMKLAPDALPADGEFDIVLIGDIGKVDFVTTSPKLYKGGHVDHHKVEVLRSSHVTIEADEPIPLELDGEVAGTTPARFEVIPNALRLRAPA